MTDKEKKDLLERKANLKKTLSKFKQVVYRRNEDEVIFRRAYDYCCDYLVKQGYKINKRPPYLEWFVKEIYVLRHQIKQIDGELNGICVPPRIPGNIDKWIELCERRKARKGE